MTLLAFLVVSLVGASAVISVVVLAFWLRPKRVKAMPTEAGPIQRGSENGLSTRQGIPDVMPGGGQQTTMDVEDTGNPPVYQIDESEYQLDELPPAYDSAPVQSRQLTRPIQAVHKRTKTWPFRSTSSA